MAVVKSMSPAYRNSHALKMVPWRFVPVLPWCCALCQQHHSFRRIDHELKDEYGLLDGAGDIVTDNYYNRDDWHQVSLTLRGWLDQCDKATPDRFSARYQRTRIVNWLKAAYERGGENEKIIPMLEQEADRFRSYDVLIKTLVDTGQHDAALLVHSRL